MTSPHTPEPAAQARPLNAYTAAWIVKMIDSRRARLDAEWETLERGSRESSENLAIENELADLKWAILAQQEDPETPAP
jgi:hypothetical protein